MGGAHAGHEGHEGQPSVQCQNGGHKGQPLVTEKR